MEAKTKKIEVGKVKKLVETSKNKKSQLQQSANYSLRGRKFEGYVIRKFDNRITIKFERMIFVRKYERYLKTYSKMHARLPENLRDQINIGDYVQIMECRPLSKIIHFIAVKKIRGADSKSKEMIKEPVKETKSKKSEEEKHESHII